jgi:hypothetical protein
MITIFSIPKPFRGHIATIQDNAIASWIHLVPECQIVLFGDEEGVGHTAAKFGIDHVPDIECNEYGTPLLASAFNIVQKTAKHPIICYANADIIFLKDMPTTVKRICVPEFLLVGKRVDIEITDPLDFETPEWEGSLRKFVIEYGILHEPDAIDYFVFPRGQVEMLPFPVGRIMWDNWLIFHARCRKIPVIDATLQILAIHQNHDYAHIEGGKRTVWQGAEAQRNWDLVGPDFYPFDIRDATLIIDEKGIRLTTGLMHKLRRCMVFPALSRPLRPMIRIARKVRRQCIKEWKRRSHLFY